MYNAWCFLDFIDKPLEHSMKSTLRSGGIVLICITCDIKTKQKTSFRKFQLFVVYFGTFKQIELKINSAHLIGNDKLLSVFTSTRQL